MEKIIDRLSDIPSRLGKPRIMGRNIVYDSGIPLKQLESFFTYAEHIDALEIGYGPALIVDDLRQRVELCKAHNITPFLTGVVFEVFEVRKSFDAYLEFCMENNIDTFQVSDSCITIPHTEKCGYIEKLSKLGTVYSRVGSQDAAHIIPPYKWIELMNAEIKAGARNVFAQSREAGNVGIYRGTGEARDGLVQEILNNVPDDKIVWDTPQIAQQQYFIEMLGADCNCSRIAPELLLSFEAMRLCLNPRTFDLLLKQNGVIK